MPQAGGAPRLALQARVVGGASGVVEAPVSVVVATRDISRKARLLQPATEVACQIQALPGGQSRVSFIARDVPRGGSKLFALRPVSIEPGKSGVEVKAAGKSVEVFLHGQLFTRYDTTSGPNKPYLYPIIYDETHFTRRWPLEEVEGEARDHPHHRGLWFTHGEMNGVDFWSEGASKPEHPVGKTLHTGFGPLVSGAISGALEARADWAAPDGKVLARDVRQIVITPLSSGVLLDFSVTVTALGGPLTWGDTKEGTFAIRVPEWMKADRPGAGTLVNAEGLTNAALWGKPSPWNDYFASYKGQAYGIAIFDHPTNPRFPTTWHSRTYGLFAANPFGLHDFDPARKNDRHGGDLVIPDGKSVAFRYRLYFHRGDTKSARIAEAFAAWAEPPRAEWQR